MNIHFKKVFKYSCTVTHQRGIDHEDLFIIPPSGHTVPWNCRLNKTQQLVHKFNSGRVAQWLRRLTSDQKIGGSNPSVVEFFFFPHLSVFFLLFVFK